MTVDVVDLRTSRCPRSVLLASNLLMACMLAIDFGRSTLSILSTDEKMIKAQAGVMVSLDGRRIQHEVINVCHCICSSIQPLLSRSSSSETGRFDLDGWLRTC